MPADDDRKPINMSYATPPPPKEQKRWEVGSRIFLGCGLSIAFALLTCIALDTSFDAGQALLIPMMFLAKLLNPYVLPEQMIAANSLFWGFLISFSIGRKSKKANGDAAVKDE